VLQRDKPTEVNYLGPFYVTPGPKSVGCVHALWFIFSWPPASCQRAVNSWAAGQSLRAKSWTFPLHLLPSWLVPWGPSLPRCAPSVPFSLVVCPHRSDSRPYCRAVPIS
jgi:hypothetical protein